MTIQDSLLSAEEIQSIRAPIESARTLPRRAFTSGEFFDREMTTIFHRNWVGLCPAGHIASVGDAFPIDAFGLPLLAVHGHDGQVRVFHNICPYDGCLVATEPSSGVSRLTVPYHGWTYGLTGELLEAPYWDGDPQSGIEVVPAEHRTLVEVASGVAFGLVFIDLSGRAGTLENHLQPLRDLLVAYDIEGIELGVDESGAADVFVDEAATNWKTVAENDCLNILHESFTHALYAASPDVPRVDDDGNPLFMVVDTGNVLGFSYLESDVANTYPPMDLPHIGRDGAPEHGYFLQLYPNVSIAVMSTLVAPNVQLPAAPDRTVVRGTTLLRPGARGPADLSKVEGVAAGFAMAAAEDGAVTAAVQVGRRSPACEQNFYSPFWDQPHYRFTNRILRDLLDDLPDPAVE